MKIHISSSIENKSPSIKLKTRCVLQRWVSLIHSPCNRKPKIIRGTMKSCSIDTPTNVNRHDSSDTRNEQHQQELIAVGSIFRPSSSSLLSTPPPSHAFHIHHRSSHSSNSSVHSILRVETEDSSSTDSAGIIDNNNNNTMNHRISHPSPPPPPPPVGNQLLARADQEMQERAKRAKELLSSKFKGIKDKQVCI